MNKDLTAGKPQSVLWRFSIPMFVSVIFQQLYNIADSASEARSVVEIAVFISLYHFAPKYWEISTEQPILLPTAIAMKIIVIG